MSKTLFGLENFKGKRLIVTAVIIAMLSALGVVLDRFLTVQIWSSKFGVGFLACAVAAAYFGPVAGAVVGGLTDFIGATLFPVGAYFPGFTVTYALSGLVFGLFLYKTNQTETGKLRLLARAFLPTLINQVLFTVFINTWFITLLYGAPYWSLMLSARIPQALFNLPIQTAALFIILLPSGAVERAMRKMTRKNR